MQTVEISISSRYENIELIQAVAEQLCDLHGAVDDVVHWIGMAVREAVANAIKHGNKLDLEKRVSARLWIENGVLTITIEDEGEGFIPEQVENPLNPENIMKTSGRGIFYINTFMDEVKYGFGKSGGTVVEMHRSLVPTEEPRPAGS